MRTAILMTTPENTPGALVLGNLSIGLLARALLLLTLGLASVFCCSATVQTFVVYASQAPPGLDTGIRVPAGARVHVSASGIAVYGTECGGLVAPDGMRFGGAGVSCAGQKYDGAATAPSAPIGGLLARIGSGAWQYAGSGWQTTNHLGGSIFLLFNDSYNGDNSGSYSVTVETDPCWPIIFRQQPQSVTGAPGQNVTLATQVSGTSPFTYQWYRGSIPLPHNAQQSDDPDSGMSSYTITNLDFSSLGAYYVAVSNCWGLTVWSFPATISMGLTNYPPTISQQPSDTTVLAGQTVRLDAGVFGDAPMSISWTHEGVLIPSATTPSLALSNVSMSAAGAYRLFATNVFGSTNSRSAMVTVLSNKPPTVTILDPVSNAVIAIPTNLLIRVAATAGSADLVGVELFVDSQQIAALSQPPYEMHYTVATDGSRTITAIVTDRNGVSTSTSSTANFGTAPQIIGQPVSQSVYSGDSISLELTATGSQPLGYQWRKASVPIAGGTHSSYSIPSAQVGDTGDYDVAVVNAYGAATSAVAHVTVLSMTPPMVTGLPLDQVLYQGYPATFTIQVGGGQLSYQWRKGSIPIVGATDATLVIPSITSTDAANYTVTVTNPMGSTSASASLTVMTAVPGSYEEALASQKPIIWFRYDDTNAPVQDMATNSGSLGASGHGVYISTPHHPTRGALVATNRTAARFATGRVSAPYSASLNPATFTVEAWLKPEVALSGTTLTCPLASVHIASPRAGWLLYQSADGWNFRTFNQNTTNPAVSITGGTPPAVGQWYHVAASWDGAVGRVYVNGLLSAISSTTNFVANLDGSFTVGARSDGASLWSGTADEVALYSTVLSDARILAHYQNGTNSAPAVAYSALITGDGAVEYLTLDEPAFGGKPVNVGTFGAGWNGAYTDAGGIPGAPKIALGLAGPVPPPFPGLGSTNTCVALTNGFVSAPALGLTTNTVTAVGWINRAAPPTTGDLGWSAWLGNGGLHMLPDGELRYHWNSGQWGWSSGLRVPTNTWTFAALVVESDRATIYMSSGSNLLTAIHSTVHVPVAFDSPVGLGGNQPGRSDRTYIGRLDETAIFARALAPEDIAALFNAATPNPHVPVVDWPPPSPITYGAALGRAQLNATSSVPGSYAYTPPAGTVLGAGTNSLSVTFTPTDSANYSQVTTGTTLLVLKAPLSVTASNASRPYGQTNPVFSGTLTGLVNGDPITASYLCSATPNSLPGTYPIAPALNDPSNRLGNYTVTTNNGTLTVAPAAPPTIASVTPNTGPTNGGTSVTILGTGFQSGATVRFGGLAAVSVNFVSATNLLAVTPPSTPGTFSIVVSNADGQSTSLNNAFTYTSSGGSAPLPAGLVSWWRAETNALDFVGTNHGTLSGAGYAPGKVGQAFAFDGANARVIVPDSGSFKLTNSLSIEGWVFVRNYPSSEQGWGMILIRGDFWTGVDPYQLGIHSSRRLAFSVTSTPTNWDTLSVPIETNRFIHVAATLDGGSGLMRLYLDGQMAGQKTTSIRPLGDINQLPGVGIGNHEAGNPYPVGLDGLVDELSLYDRALTSNEVAAIYAAGSAGKGIPPTILAQPMSRTNVAGSTASLNVTANSSDPLSYAWRFNGQPLAEGGQFSGTTTSNLVITAVTTNNAGSYSVVVSNPYGSVTSQVAVVTVNLYVPPPSGLVAWWRAESNAFDFVGTNHGTLKYGATFAPGKVGQAFSLDGVDDYVEVPNGPALNPTNAITVEAWYKPTVAFAGAGANPIVTKPYTSHTPPYYQYHLWVTGDQYSSPSSRGTFGFYVTVGGTNVPVRTPPDFWTVGQWYHLAGIYDGSSVKLYVNGILITSTPASENMTDYGQKLCIGRNPNLSDAGSWTPGLVDEVSIYNRALSSTEIGAIYAAGRAGKWAWPQTELTASDGSTNDFFGSSAAISADGNTALVGAFTDDTAGGVDAGSAYVYVRSGGGWVQQTKLTASDAAAGDMFGVSASLSAEGNTALVGAYQADTAGGADAGCVYVFVRNGSTWTQQTKLTASDSAAGERFGWKISLSADGNTALAGAPLDDTAAGADAGSAYVFVRSGSTWAQQAKLTSSDAAAGDAFGSGVGLSTDGNTALLGAYTDDTAAGADAGSAYVFVRSGSTWTQQAKLTASDGVAGDAFGVNCSLSGNGSTALVGAYLDDTAAGVDAGSAYVFVRSGSTWTQQAKLTAEDALAGDALGVSVSINGDGNTALVGAYGADTAAGMNAGSAYVFARSGTNWSQRTRLTGTDSAANDRFGNSNAAGLSADATTAIVGAYQHGTAAGTNAGSAYVFQLTPLEPQIVTGPQPQIAPVGSNATFTVTLTGATPMSYQWRKFGATVPGATNATLTLTNVQLADAGDYDVVVANAYGSVTSAPPATLTVLSGGTTFADGTFNDADWELTTITNTSGKGGSTATTQVSTGGNPGSFRQVTVTVNASPGTYTSVAGFHRRIGASFNPLIQGAIQAIDYSEDAKSLSSFQGTGPALRQGTNVFVCYGLDTRETVWTNKAARLLNANNFIRVDPADTHLMDTNGHPDFSASGLPIDFGFYRWNATPTNGSGYTTVVGIDNWTVTVWPTGGGQGPTITAQPQGLTVAAGSNATFSVTANGTPPLSYQWRKNGGSLSGASSTTLMLTNVQLADAGSYSVVVSNTFGFVTSQVAVLSVVDPDIAAGLIAWWRAEGNALDSVGTHHGTPTNGAGFGPGLFGQAFQLDGTNDFVEVPDSPDFNFGNTNDRPFSLALWVRRANTNTGGALLSKYDSSTTPRNQQYILDFSNDGTLWFTLFQAYLDYRRGVRSGLPCVTDTNWHHVAATYDPSQGVNGMALYVDGYAVVRTNYLDNPLYVGMVAMPESLKLGCSIDRSGTLNCHPGQLDEVRVYNRALSAGEVALVYAAPFQAAPGIVSQPVGRTNVVGSTATLTVTASGSAPLSYQWRCNGTNLVDGARVVGATSNQLTLLNVLVADAGSYSVIVSNTVGTTNSQSATLTVLKAVPTLTWANPANILYGTALSGVQLNATSSVPGTFVYTPLAGTVLNAGNGQTLSVTFTPTDGTNYTTALTNVAINVLKASLLARANDTNRLYGAVNPAFTLAYSGFTNGDTAVVIDVPPTANTTTTPTNPVGNYPIVLTGGSDNNYSLTLSNGTLTVTAAPLSVTASNATRLYGQTNPPFGGTLAGLVNGDPITATYTCNATPNSLPGTYPIVPALNDPSNRLGNYTVTTNNGTLTVAPAAPPTIASVTPNTGPTNGGTAVTILGSGFQPGATVRFGGLAAVSVNFVSATNLLAVTPPSVAGAVSVVITNADGQSASLAGGFTYQALGGCASVPAGLVAWWRAEGDALDVGGTNQGVLLPGTTFTSGKVGQAFQFSGGGGVQVSNRPSLQPSQVSVGAWVKATSPGSARYIVSKLYDGGQASYALYSGGGGLMFYVTIGGIVWSPIAPGSLWDGQFHYAVGTYDGTAVRLFVDGVEIDAGTPASGAIAHAGRNLYLGSFDGSSLDWPGAVDEVEIYNRALTAGEIAAIYNAGSAGKCMSGQAPAITAQPQNQIQVAGSNATFTVTASGTAPLSYQWRKNGGSLSGATSTTLTLTNVQLADAGSYSVVVSNSYGSVTSQVAVLSVTTPGIAGMTAWWRMEGNGLDAVGANHGALNGGVGFTNGMVGQALNLDGVDDYLEVPNAPALNPTNQITVEAWYRAPGSAWAGSGNDPIVDKAFSSHSWPYYQYHLGVDAAGRAFSFSVGAGGNYCLASTANGAWTYGNWYHLAGTYDGSQVRLYVNGVLAGTTPASGLMTDYGTPLRIGRYVNASAYLRGVVDELSLYNRALSAAEILAIYQAGAAGKVPSSQSPAITAQPQSQTNVVGNVVTLTVTATGTAPLGYTWQCAGTNLLDTGRVTGSQSNRLTVAGVWMSDAGAYRVVVTNTSGSVTSAVATLTVLKATPTLTWSNPVAIWYGTGLGSNQLNATASVPGSFAYAPASGVVLDAGTNALSVVFTPTDTANYNSVTGSVALVVLKTPLTVTANNATRAYGTTNPLFTAAITGLTNNDNLTVSNYCAATPGSPAGIYAIVPSLVDPNSRQANYAVTLSNGTLTVLKATPTLTWATPAAIPYGAALGSNQLNATASVPGALVYSPASGLVLDAGTNALSVVFTPTDTTNYNSVPGSVALVVLKTPLTVTANNATRAYGTTNPVFTATITGLTNNDNLTVSNYCAATPASPAGNYPIVPSLVDPNNRAPNYTVSLNNGTLTVTSTNTARTVRVGDTNGFPGALVNVPLELAAQGDENTVACSLAFDPTLLSYQSNAPGSALGTGAQLIMNTNQSGAGRLGILLGAPSGTAFPAGVRQLVVFTFLVSPMLTTATNLTVSFTNQPTYLEVGSVNADTLPASFLNGTIQVTVGDEADVSPRPNGDGRVTATDWTLIGRFVTGLSTISNAVEFMRADCAPRSSSGDGRITGTDWTQVGRYVVGLDPIQRAGGPTQPVGGAPGLSAGRGRKDGDPQRVLRLVGGHAEAGATVAVPVSLTALGNENTAAFSVESDPGVLELVSAVGGSNLTVGSQVVLNTNYAGVGRLGVLLGLPSGRLLRRARRKFWW